MIDKIINWIKNNVMLFIIIAVAAVFLFFPRMFRGILGTSHKRRHHKNYILKRHYSAPGKRRVRTNRKPIPRSVGLHKISGRGYPKAGGGYIPFKHNKDGSIKKAQFVAGTLAAKRRMASLRKQR
jgi:hypothetical protein